MARWNDFGSFVMEENVKQGPKMSIERTRSRGIPRVVVGGFFGGGGEWMNGKG
jgi:hypothetical protein